MNRTRKVLAVLKEKNEKQSQQQSELPKTTPQQLVATPPEPTNSLNSEKTSQIPPIVDSKTSGQPNCSSLILTKLRECDEESNPSEWDFWDPMGEDYNSTRNTLAINPLADPISAITGKIMPSNSEIGATTICEHYRRFGECADGVYCDKYHVNTSLNENILALQNAYEINKDRRFINYTFLSQTEIEPDPSALLLVSVAGPANPANFYFVAPFESMNFANLTQDDIVFYLERVQQTSIIKIKLQSCHEDMAAVFDHPYRIDNVNDEILVSQIVACKLKDGNFRRAMVIDRPDPTEEKFDFKLLLIDVGIEVELPREMIYDIKANCLSEPPMALIGRLDIKPANGQLEWSEEALDLFKKKTHIEEPYLLCKILDYLECDRMFTVDLYHPMTRKSLKDTMLELGLAEKCSL